MSGRQAKLDRREIRRASEPAVRAMQEAQENAIKAAIERCNVLTYAHQVLTAHIHTLEKRLESVDEGAWKTLRADHDRLIRRLAARDRTIWTRLRGIFTGGTHGQQISSDQRESGKGRQSRAPFFGQDIPAEKEGVTA